MVVRIKNLIGKISSSLKISSNNSKTSESIINVQYLILTFKVSVNSIININVH